MNLFLHRSPFWLKKFFSEYTWRIDTKKPVIYITFDDGPIPEVTEFVLTTLKEFKAKATFFCIGDNIRKHPHIFQQILEEGHSVGNHTYNHLNGWRTALDLYLENIQMCAELIPVDSSLFRPPYGRIKSDQFKILPREYKVVMWDVLSGDFSPSISPETCLKKSIKYSRNGSIVLFHDSIKANKNMSYTLPRFLEHFQNLGFEFEAIPMDL